MQTNKDMVKHLVNQGYIKTTKLKNAFLAVDRRKFVLWNYEKFAYADEALPIGYGQTISAPSIIAEMLEILDILPDNKVLEVGTGSGYVTALLSNLAREVYSIEIVPQLFYSAKDKLKSYNNVKLFIGSGWEGLPNYVPYDRIILGCAPEEVPDKLLSQLSSGGRAVFPLGPRWDQRLYLARMDGKVKLEDLEIQVVFVPMVKQTP